MSPVLGTSSSCHSPRGSQSSVNLLDIPKPVRMVSSSMIFHLLCAPFFSLRATSWWEPPMGTPYFYPHLLLFAFLIHPTSTTSHAEKGLSPLGSNFILFPPLKYHFSPFTSHTHLLSASLAVVPAWVVRITDSPCPHGAHILLEEKDNKHTYAMMPGNAMTKILRGFSCLTFPEHCELWEQVLVNVAEMGNSHIRCQ